MHRAFNEIVFRAQQQPPASPKGFSSTALIKILRVLGVTLLSVITSSCTSPKLPPRAANGEIQQGIRDGRTLWELGKLDEAEVKFQNVLAVATNNVAAAYYLAWVHREQKDHRRPAIFTYPKTVVTNYQRMPLQQRTLASFGHFDASTTVEDVINRVGPPDLQCSVSGSHFITYFLPPPDANAIYINSPGGSLISGVQYGTTVLYERGPNDW